MVRIVAGIVVLTACGYMGLFLADKFKRRVRELEELENAMTQLEYMIDFLGITLSEAFAKIASNTETQLKWVFLYVSERLKKSPSSNMQGVWQRAIEKYREGLSLSDKDLEILKDFAAMLGTGDRETEKNNIKITTMRLKLAAEEARLERGKNVKMYRGLGFLCGMLIVIVLI